MEEARLAAQSLLAREPQNADALHLLGIILLQSGQGEDAVEHISRSLSVNPANASAHCNLGIALRSQGRVDEAIGSFERALELEPAFIDGHNSLGNALVAAGRFEEAAGAYGQALELNPDYAEGHFNLGIALENTGDIAAAEASYCRAIEINPVYDSALNNLGNLIKGQNRGEEAETCFRKAVEANPANAQAQNNLGTILLATGRRDEAITCFTRAIEGAPGFFEAHNNLAVALAECGRLEEARASFKEGLSIAPGNPGILIGYSDLLRGEGNIGEAIACLKSAGDDANAVVEARLFEHMRAACDWEGLEEVEQNVASATTKALAAAETPAENPFVNIFRCDDEEVNLAVARAHSADLSARVGGLGLSFSGAGRTEKEGPLTIGYLSSDLRNHAIGHLTAGIFKRHDRSKFTIAAYALGPEDDSDCRRRIKGDCDHFVELGDLPYEAAAKQIHDDGVDILVDLNGYTARSRLEICALRPAPVQVTYLGFPGTSGASFFDYVIADPIVAPEGDDDFFSEKIIRLPHCYQANDCDQAISESPMVRSQFGLPEKGVVFASFNQAYKIDPVMFDAWMRVLQNVEGSVLWLLGQHDLARENLLQQAEGRGVDPARLVFAGKMPKDAHLARHRLADLALDTRIYNGHTTTSDALWAGLPVVALEGRHFASRVSSSLLRAAGAPELITHSLADYEALALRLARSPGSLAELKVKIAVSRKSCPLFNTDAFVSALETAYLRIWSDYRAGLPPQAFAVPEG